MRFVTQFFLTIVFCSQIITAQQINSPRFEDYRVSKFKGKIRSPKWIKIVSKGEWRDDLGKLVAPPEINFGEKYYVAAHSCGTGCRYYTMTDLSTGKEIDSLDVFASAEPLLKTSDGREYLTILYYRPNSKLLIAQYLVGFNSESEQCRERAFVFNNGNIKPLGKIKYKCRKL